MPPVRQPTQAKLTIRLPRPLHERIVQLARDERRSVNNWLIRLLEDYIQAADARRPTQRTE